MTDATYQWEWPHTLKWPKFNNMGEHVDTLKKLFLAGEALNVNNFIKFFADECYYQFGNFPPAKTPQEIKAASQGFIESCEGLHHRILNISIPSEDTVLVEMVVTYISHSGKIVTLPCFDIVKYEGALIKELKIFMDINPLFQD
jgi:hypothetical protein